MTITGGHPPTGGTFPPYSDRVPSPDLPREQTLTEQYPCPGGCGGFVPVPSPCITCWLSTRTYSRREVAMLPDTDPRKARVRPDPRYRGGRR